ncbi:thiamine phosphate synthase [Emcibacteraceae bacterium]|jgi:thiamine-phosphate pyrophosphorylase|uniref:thiamine phosphate synthase n=1 Tax=Pseudemcibacter sp. TaxID=2943293 RepID=UPI00230E7961|nr:thiamine phosphate synthase [Kordiimonadaceae bacterium]MDA9554432.1 thiamine phosphate synthase [Emcibacteraceae bacterium]MDA9769815.1 thiamine phosphate synthase [Emcibacteraceae bacterium]MDC1090686.1 thiamine phosphate synthase [Emcibacteraceae bacterium]MDG1019960.1 thiamine phosphate synthase [Emcibacteraceae bacterium]
MSDARLYLITPSSFNLYDFAIELQNALEGGDVASLQLRMKESYDEDIIKAARSLMPICHAKDVAFIINDRPDIAQKVGADGVHVGQDDMNYKEAREILGPDKIIGVTCKDSKHLAMTAGEQGADYVAFGAFYPTPTKITTSVAHPSLLTWWQELFEIPCVAIGGITVDNATELANAGADFLAICGGVWDYKDGPKQAVHDLNQAIK